MKQIESLKKKEKASKGITLIALVITIIVLLILTAVSISVLFGEGGLLNQAQTAKTKTNEATGKEEVILAYNKVQTDGIPKGWDLTKKANELQSELQKTDSSSIVTVDGTSLKVTYKGYSMTIDDKGNIDIAGTGETLPTLTLPTTENTKPYLPEENTTIISNNPATGIIIKDSNNNEWVWIEVPKSIYTTAKSNTDYGNIEKDMQTYSRSL